MYAFAKVGQTLPRSWQQGVELTSLTTVMHLQQAAVEMLTNNSNKLYF